MVPIEEQECAEDSASPTMTLRQVAGAPDEDVGVGDGVPDATMWLAYGTRMQLVLPVLATWAL